MILVDTGIWIDFWHHHPNRSALSGMLNDNRVCIHPWIWGELMVGNLGSKRHAILANLQLLPHLPVYDIEELQIFIDREKLFGRGFSFVDLHLIYAAILNDTLLWTGDQNLRQLAQRYEKAYP